MFKNFNAAALGVSGTTSEVIELALSFGFKGLDLDIAEQAAQAEVSGVAKVRQRYEGARLKFGAFRLPVEWHEDGDRLKQDLAALPAYLEVAQGLGCTRAITQVEPAGDMRPYHENFEYHRRTLEELAKAVGKFGIRLGVEFLAPNSHRQGRAFQFIQTVDQFLLLFKSTHADNLGIVLDTWHWQVGGGTQEYLQALEGNKIVAVYLADCDAEVTAANAIEGHQRLPGETGVVDCVSILTTLAEKGYEGPVTPYAYKGNLTGGREKVVKAASAALDQVWKQAGLNSQGKLTPAAK
jgi:sugar phosphate isomerase/epimerase